LRPIDIQKGSVAVFSAQGERMFKKMHLLASDAGTTVFTMLVQVVPLTFEVDACSRASTLRRKDGY